MEILSVDLASGESVWRIVNSCIALAGLVLLTWQLIKNYKRMNPRSRLLSQALIGMLVAVVIGMAENIKQDNPVGFRTAMVSASLIWTLVAVLITKPRDSYEYKK